MSDVLEGVRRSFKKKQRQAYQTARRELEQQIVKEEVVLEYSFEERNGLNERVPEVSGKVKAVNTGTIMEKGIEFTVFVEFEDGRTFVDPEEIYITDQ